MKRWVAQLARFSYLFCLLWFIAAPAARAEDKPLKAGKVGVQYTESVDRNGQGGSPPRTWSLTADQLPAGLSLSTTGQITGTPTAAGNQPYSFELTVSDSSHPPMTVARRYSIAITSDELRIVDNPAQTTTTATDDNKEWEARAIVGYHQAGASSAKFTQNFFFDFFIMRALSKEHLWVARWNLWGDVRIASFPQQVTSGVGTFASNFGTQLSNIPVNQLAQSADFQTGLEFRLKTWTRQRLTDVLGYRMLGMVGYVGAIGAFQPPDAQMQIFNVPSTNSPQYDKFAKQFLGGNPPQGALATAKYVGLVPPDRERFYRNYGVGFRVTTFEKDRPLAPPATYTISFGQDEAISGGTLTSVVGKIDVFYPLRTGNTSGKYDFIFLFGTANLRLSKATEIPTFALQNPNESSMVVQPFDPALVVFPVRRTRDTYRIGVGVDLINLVQSILKKDQVPGTK
jgi:hypothetical protein